MNSIITLDKNLFLWLNHSLNSPCLDHFFWLITWLGNGWILAFITGLGLWFYDRDIFKYHWPWMMLATLLSGLTVVLIKSLIARPRPLAEFAPLIQNGQLYINVLGSALKTNSFPSGHTQVAFAVATYLSLIFRKVAFIFLMLACLVGISRIYLGVHFPLDVLVGAMIGGGFSVIVWKWRKKFYQKHPL